MKTSNCPHDEGLKVDGEVKPVVGDTSVSSGGAGLADGAPSTNENINIIVTINHRSNMHHKYHIIIAITWPLTTH